MGMRVWSSELGMVPRRPHPQAFGLGAARNAPKALVVAETVDLNFD